MIAYHTARLVRLDDPSIAVEGTTETMLVMYPIRPAFRKGRWTWEYTGGEPTEYDETAEQRSELGEPLFQDENGVNVPLSNVGVVTTDPASGDDLPPVPLRGVPEGPVRGEEYQRSKLVGYSVSPVSERSDPEEAWTNSYMAVSPDDESIGTFLTERDAWEACDRHRMFGAV